MPETKLELNVAFVLSEMFASRLSIRVRLAGLLTPPETSRKCLADADLFIPTC